MLAYSIQNVNTRNIGTSYQYKDKLSLTTIIKESQQEKNKYLMKRKNHNIIINIVSHYKPIDDNITSSLASINVALVMN